MTSLPRLLQALAAVVAIGALVPLPTASQSYTPLDCAIKDLSCRVPTGGASCPSDGSPCDVPPGIYTCDQSGKYHQYYYCIFNDMAGNRLGMLYSGDSDCKPVEFTGGSPKLQWDPLLNMFAINACVMYTDENVEYGPYLVRAA